jgi:hypothetical protein
MSGIRIRPSEHMLILGKTGSGKTFATKNVLVPALRKQKNNFLVILDPKQEYEDITKNIVHSPKQLNELLYGDEKPQMDDGVVRCAINEPSEAAAEEYLRAAWGPFADVQIGTYYKPTFGIRFFIEDMPIFYDSAYQTPPMLKKWVTMGRGPHRTIVATSQRAQLIPKTVMTQVDHLFVFRVSEYDGKRVIREYYGDKASYAVANIPKFGYVLISDLYEEPIVFDPYQPTKAPKEEEGIEL